MQVQKRYLQKAAVWIVVFLFHFLIFDFVLKPNGMTLYSENSWIAGLFSILYVVVITALIWWKKLFVVEWKQVLLLVLFAISFAGISVVLVYFYQFINNSLPKITIQGAETPFLFLSYIFPRTANIIYQQIMIFYLLQLTDDFYKEIKGQSLWVCIVFGITHLPIFLTVLNPYVAAGVLVCSFIFGYFLPHLYQKVIPNGLLFGYAIHYSFYLIISPVGYFLFRLIG